MAPSVSSEYDNLVRRDRDVVTADANAQYTLEESVYYLQNWRGDVVALADQAGRRIESVRYSAYGRPFNIMAGDWNASGGVGASGSGDDDGALYVTDWLAAQQRTHPPRLGRWLERDRLERPRSVRRSEAGHDEGCAA